MLLLITEAIHKAGGDDLQFFQSAYYWKFQKQVDVWGDVLAWRVQKRVPSYVKEYVSRIYKV